jgi:hypothetical protein
MSQAPEHYVKATRVVLKFAAVMAGLSMLAGIAFQESAKKLPIAETEPGLHAHAVETLALSHGHFMVVGVLLPIALIGALWIGRAAGFRDVKPLTTKMLTRGYLPFATVSLLLMLYKGYHVLLSVRWGETDLGVVDAAYFGGSTAARHAVYGIAHTAMAVSLGLFLFGLWRSLRPPKAA